jgi:hypothetical protein
MAHVDHADIVNGTRIVERLRELLTYPFMHYGDFLLGNGST